MQVGKDHHLLLPDHRSDSPQNPVLHVSLRNTATAGRLSFKIIQIFPGICCVELTRQANRIYLIFWIGCGEGTSVWIHASPIHAGTQIRTPVYLSFLYLKKNKQLEGLLA